MKKLEKLIRRLLKWALPFSGDKTKIAAWILGLIGIQNLGAVDLTELIALLSTPSGGLGGGVALLLVGLLDKYLKKKYPDHSL